MFRTRSHLRDHTRIHTGTCMLFYNAAIIVLKLLSILSIVN